MRVAILNPCQVPGAASPADLLDRVPTLAGWAQAVQAAGAEVVVVQACARTDRVSVDGVGYSFVATGSRTPPRWSAPRALVAAVRGARPDLVHLNGLAWARLAARLGRDLPVVLQDHAGRPSAGLKARVQRRWLRRAAGFLFTGRELAEPWRRAGVIRSTHAVFEIMEGSTRFTPGNRAAARAVTGSGGDPMLLWTGHLDANKDPLTVLEGFRGLLGSRPAARLYMCHGTAGLHGQVAGRIASDPVLGPAVTLVGTVDQPELEAWYRSADLFVQGSHREGSGYAVAEAMACGTPPVVTDIASFRFMTGDGEVGALWRPGDPAALEQALLTALERDPESERAATRALFDRRLSWPAIGRGAVAIYRQLAGRAAAGSRTRQGATLPDQE
jgi:glycosyltransferase involved in cell wall biosynthesis